ncbi:MAG TPA: FMN-binding negative transcriptional regulator [Planktothrix sp.]|jgi:transcriptional regulator
MYTPQSFKEDRIEVLHDFIKSNPLGLLISNGAEGPLATAIPFHLVNDGSEFGMFQAHLARANPHWQSIDNQNILIVFQGTDAYISPSWYPSKLEHGKVVPTWNYIMIQARGIAKVMDDPEWIKRQITALTNQQEQDKSDPWKVSYAPESYIDTELRAIVGLEIKISQMEGKWKLSQNRNLQDRRGVAENLQAEGNTEMSSLVRQYGRLDETT